MVTAVTGPVTAVTRSPVRVTQDAAPRATRPIYAVLAQGDRRVDEGPTGAMTVVLVPVVARFVAGAVADMVGDLEVSRPRPRERVRLLASGRVRSPKDRGLGGRGVHCMVDETATAPRQVRFICFLCGASCGLCATVDGDRITKVVADRDHPATRGYSCTKGRSIPEVHHAPNRLDRPRLDGRDVEWPVLLDDLAGKLQSLKAEHGPDSIARFFGTGFFFINEAFGAATFFGALGTQQLYGAMTLDTAPFLRAAELVTGFARSTPVWAPDDPASTLAVIIGQNPSNSGGYSGTPSSNFTQRVRAFRQRGGEIWAIDPRATRTAGMVDRHLAPRPGSDVFIFGWLARELLRDGFDAHELEVACDPDDVEHLRAVVEAFDLELVTRRTGLAEHDLLDLLAAIRRHGRVSLLPGTGVSFSPTAVLTYWLIWAVGIITGSLDRSGGMRFLPESTTMMDGPRRTGHAPESGAFGPGPASRPELKGVFGERPAVALVDEIEAGNIRALMIMGANPVAAAPDPDRLLAALATLPVLAVFDIVEWELTRIATHVIPCTWLAERNDMRFLPQYGAERTYVTPAIVAPGADRRHGWQVLSELGARMGFDIFDVLPGVDAETATDEGLMRAIGRLTCDDADNVFAAGTDGVRVEFRYGWFHEQVLPDGRWRLAPRVLTDRIPGVLASEDTSGPRLVSGRTLASVNSSHYAVPLDEGPPPIRISADVARERAIETGDRVRVRTARGEVAGAVLVDPSMARETVWIAHGWHEQNVNRLTDPAPDPLTGQPSVTGVPVEVERLPS